MLNLERQDEYLIGGGILAVGVLAYIAYLMHFPRVVETLLDGFSTVFGLATAYFVYRGSRTLGGNMGRAIAVMGAGVLYYTVTLIPHVMAHIAGYQFIPAYFFQHTLATWSFVFVTYGAYRFWRGGKA
ncbi:MAG: hypothetical protein ABEJ69_03670 [Candidatus Nanohaloarchaea archaeon]